MGDSGISRSSRHGLRVLALSLSISMVLAQPASAALPRQPQRTASKVTGISTLHTPIVVVPVTSCADSGPGSLRAIASTAVSGSVVDLSSLQCSRITLTSGAIAIAADDLTIAGPGRDALTLDGNASGRVIIHTGGGTLAISDVAIANGMAYSRYSNPSEVSRGGCINSAGSVALEHVIVSACVLDSNAQAWGGCLYAVSARIADSTLSGCEATTTGYTARGGALVAAAISIDRSTLKDNKVVAHNGEASGGATFSTFNYGVSDSLIVDSTFSGNIAEGPLYVPYGYTGSVNKSTGGAMNNFWGRLVISGTTLENNVAGNGAGLFIANTGCEPDHAVIINSTISGNSASDRGGGILNQYCPVAITGSTIAFNSAGYGGGGVVPRTIQTYYGASSMTVDSTIIANNSSPIGASDMHSPIIPGDLVEFLIQGSNSLIVDANVTLPVDTLRGDPLLAPVANNGGPTRTIALLPGSPAIDAGRNVLDLAFDQRGEGHDRVVGAAADIGAFEVNEVIFRDGFD